MQMRRRKVLSDRVFSFKSQQRGGVISASFYAFAKPSIRWAN